jgi:hypothetical protein
VGGLRDPILGDGSRAVELLLEGAADISRALGHDGRVPQKMSGVLNPTSPI